MASGHWEHLCKADLQAMENSWIYVVRHNVLGHVWCMHQDGRDIWQKQGGKATVNGWMIKTQTNPKTTQNSVGSSCG